TMSVPPGKYFVSASAPGWQLRSASVGGRDASDVPIDLENEDAGGAVVTFYDRPAQLSGVVHDDKGAPDATATVMLFPADFRTWMQNGMSSARMRTNQVGADGRYQFGGLKPGEYVIVAVRDAPTNSNDRSALIESSAPLATRISLGDSARQTQD